MRRRLLQAAAGLALAALVGCGALPDKPVNAIPYDLGPLPVAGTGPAPTARPLVLPQLEVAGTLESRDMLYRLLYEDPQQLRAYAYARWSARPDQLVHQRLQAHLARHWPVLDWGAAATLRRQGGTTPPVLRLQLEEFAHHFDSRTDSRGRLQLRATLLEGTAAGDRVLAQRTFALDRAAPSADAAGGARALAAAVDAAAQDLVGWLEQVR